MALPPEVWDERQAQKACLFHLQSGLVCYTGQETEFGCLFLWNSFVLNICGVVSLILGQNLNFKNVYHKGYTTETFLR